MTHGIRQRIHLRGVSLVEIGIVLVIASLIGSLAMFSYFQILKTSRSNAALRQIEVIKEAMVNYAAAHKTGQLILETTNVANPPLEARWTLPAGRPYLPCPDVTGDGIEDRQDLHMTQTIAIVVDLSDTADLDENLLGVGGCFSSRGAVPWNTLNTPPTDPWGNRYTYHVMPAFSAAVMGFDQHTIPDNILKHVVRYDPLVGELSAVSFEPGKTTTNTGPAPWVNLQLEHTPLLVCDEEPCPREIKTCTAMCPDGNEEGLVAGDVRHSGMTETTLFLPRLIDLRIDQPVGRVAATFNFEYPYVHGLPFVVLSHGDNGNGAIQGNNNNEFKFQSSNKQEFNCNAIATTARALTGRVGTALVLRKHRDNEIQNATWPSLIATASGPSYNCAEVLPPAGGENYGFVDGINHGIQIAGGAGSGEFSEFFYDDIVGWLSAEEIAAQLGRRGVFPARLVPPIGWFPP